jgi:hypothetical protein
VGDGSGVTTRPAGVHVGARGGAAVVTRIGLRPVEPGRGVDVGQGPVIPRAGVHVGSGCGSLGAASGSRSVLDHGQMIPRLGSRGGRERPGTAFGAGASRAHGQRNPPDAVGVGTGLRT